MNLHPGGLIGCSITFAIHLIASQFSRRPLASFLVTIVLGAAIAVSALSEPLPVPPSPPTPSVLAIAYMK